jgi:hypothetical protein
MIIPIALGAAQGLALLDAMAKDLAKTDRLSGYISLRRPNQQPAKLVFALAKPNRFEVKGPGINVRFDGTKRWTLKQGKWVAISKDGSLPSVLRGFEPFFGQGLGQLPKGAVVAGVPGEPYALAANQTLFVNKTSKRPVARSFTNGKGETTWLYYKLGKPSMIVAKRDHEEPKPMGKTSTALNVPLPMSEPVNSLVDLKISEVERPVPPVPLDAQRMDIPEGASANAKPGQAPVSVPAELAARLPKPGDMVAMFELPSHSGGTLNLTKILEKSTGGAVLVFWQTTCPASAQFLPYLESQRLKMRDSKVYLLGINCGDSADSIKNYLKQHKLGITSGMTPDGDSDLRDRFGVAAYPTTIIIDGQGKVVARFVGDDASAFEQGLASLKGK